MMQEPRRVSTLTDFAILQEIGIILRYSGLLRTWCILSSVQGQKICGPAYLCHEKDRLRALQPEREGQRPVRDLHFEGSTESQRDLGL
jgi:hypothetical protein